LAKAIPPSDIVSANMSATIINEMRFLISSHLLSLLADAKTGLPLTEIAGCATGSPRPSFSAHL
jgi:hypothetical protein